MIHRCKAAYAKACAAGARIREAVFGALLPARYAPPHKVVANADAAQHPDNGEEPEKARMALASCEASDSEEEADEAGWLTKRLPVLSYPGWKQDIAEVEAYHWEGTCIRDALGNIRRKQQQHSGDRSHPVTQVLDVLVPTLSYPGWHKDVAEVAQCTRSSLIYSTDRMWMRKLERMRERQHVYSGDRSHPDLQALDALSKTLSYSGWAEDVSKAEACHWEGTCIRDALGNIRRKQQQHSAIARIRSRERSMRSCRRSATLAGIRMSRRWRSAHEGRSSTAPTGCGYASWRGCAISSACTRAIAATQTCRRWTPSRRRSPIQAGQKTSAR
jgi:hypothetical protein